MKNIDIISYSYKINIDNAGTKESFVHSERYLRDLWLFADEVREKEESDG